MLIKNVKFLKDDLKEYNALEVTPKKNDNGIVGVNVTAWNFQADGGKSTLLFSGNNYTVRTNIVMKRLNKKRLEQLDNVLEENKEKLIVAYNNGEGTMSTLVRELIGV